MDKIPQFRLKDENGEILISSFLEGMRMIIAYVPDLGDDSVMELQELDSIYQKLMIRNIPILAVMPVPTEDLKDLMDREGLRIKLLSDDGSFAESFGVKDRTTFFIGRESEIIAQWDTPYNSVYVPGIYDKVKSVLK